MIHSKLELIWCHRFNDDGYNHNINDDGDICIMMNCLFVCDVLSSLFERTPGPQLECLELNDNLFIMMKCLSVRDFLSSLPALPSGESFVMLFCVANGNIGVIEMEVLLWEGGGRCRLDSAQVPRVKAKSAEVNLVWA